MPAHLATAPGLASSCQDRVSSLSLSFIPGEHVVVHGLRKAAHLNGSRGNIIEFIPTTRRYRVKLEDGSIRALNIENLTRALDELVTHKVIESAFREGIQDSVARAKEVVGHALNRAGIGVS